MARVALSFAGAVITYIALLIFVPKMRKAKSKGDQMVAAAKAAGRTATGTLVHSEFHPGTLRDGPERGRRDVWDVAYEYQAGDYHGVFRGWMHLPVRHAPETMELYYEEGAPEEACPADYGRYGAQGSEFTAQMALPLLLFLVYYFVVFK